MSVLLCLLAAVLLFAGVALADEAGDLLSSADGLQPSIVLEAPLIYLEDSKYVAEGEVTLRSDNKRIDASLLKYDQNSKGIWAKDASITTCTHDKPHYRLRIRKCTISENRWLDARDLKVELGNVCIFYLPWIKMQLNHGKSGTSIIPSIWYDEDAGLSLSKGFLIIDKPRLRSNVTAKISQKLPFETKTTFSYGINGNLRNLPGRELSVDYWGPSSLFQLRSARQDYSTEDSQSAYKPARLKALLEYSTNQKTDDIGDRKIRVQRRPEVSLRYTAHPIGRKLDKIDPALLLAPVVDVSWGKINERLSDLPQFNRTKVCLSAGVNPFYTGKNLAIQPVFQQTWYRYNTANNYRVFAYGLDVARLYGEGTDVNLRYVKRSSTGKPVLRSEDVDVQQAIQLATNLSRGGRKLGLAMAYDLKKSNLYEWEAGFGYETDCLDVGMYYNNRLRRVGFNLILKNL